MNYFSMFSGIGGFELGIQSAIKSHRAAQQASADSGYSANNTSDPLQERGQSATCVGYSEIDKYAIKVYERHFNHDNYGDATTINPDTLPDFELLVGGFPCQAFSVAGKRAGFNDTRGTLFFDIARILKEKQPRHLVLENVKGLLSHDSGRTFTTIIGVLTDLGYSVEWQVLNSKDFGVPQNRERVIIVGHLRGTPRPEVFPLYGHGKKDSGPGKPVFSTVRATYPGNWNGDYIDTDTEYRQEESRFESARIRRLTPLECERLQAFPDNWTKYGINEEPISDTQRYKMCGNAVTVNVVQAVMERLLSHTSDKEAEALEIRERNE